MLRWTEDFRELDACQHILVHLNQETWTRGPESDAFAHEVCDAMRAGVHRLLVHEVRGARLDDEARLGCSFEHLIATTRDYLKTAGKLYRTEIAMNLLGGEWRESGLVMLLREIIKGVQGPVIDPEEPTQRPSSVPPPSISTAEAGLRLSDQDGKLCVRMTHSSP